MKPLLNFRMNDGSRHFVSLPESYPLESFRDRMAKLPGAAITGFLTDQVTEVWIDFSYEGHAFTINNPFGEYWFFVRDPKCDDAILRKIIDHASGFLDEELARFQGS